MEKWKTKGKGNCKADSLLPPTRRFPNSTPHPQSDKKKEKKWSIGGFLRRISSVRDGDSSSVEEDTTEPKKHALSIRKTKNAAFKSKPVFDHIVFHPVQKSEVNDGNCKELAGVYRETNADISSNHSQESLQVARDSMQSRSSDGSLDGLSKKDRKGKIKARVEARRDRLCADSSSDEDSHKSNSSLFKFRSDESLRNIHRDDLCNRRSRAARTERYIKRLSRDDCNNESNSNGTKANNNSHSEHSEGNNDTLMQQNLADKSRPPIHPPRFITQINSQASTIPEKNSLPSNASKIRSPTFYSENCIPDQIKPDFGSLARHTLEYCTDRNKNKSLVEEKKRRANSYDNRRHQSGHNDILLSSKKYALPYVDSSLQSMESKIIPPQPPPRDPQRRVLSFGSYDNTRPNSYSFDNRFQNVHNHTNDGQLNLIRPMKPRLNNPRCYNSNDEITWFDSVTSLGPRPSSVNSNVMQEPRKSYETDCKSCSYNHSDEDNSHGRPLEPHLTSKKKGVEHQTHCSSESSGSSTLGRKLKPISPLNCGPQLFRKDSQPPVPQKRISIEDDVSNRSRFPVPVSESSENQITSTLPSPPDPPVRNSSHMNSVSSDVGASTTKRNSKNLEEALCELEAIYNSLRLGDEDLLERAEQRSMEEFKNKGTNGKAVEHIRSLSDGSSQESIPDEKYEKPRFLRKSDVPDRLKDDMAYRRMNPKERPSSLDGQASLSQISYLFASPILSRKDAEYIDPKHKVHREEPDVTRDDVVFRNIHYANNTLKVIEPQPPFGIPLGPVASATDSDYLHTTPIKPEHPRSRYIPKSEANIVTDDLAFRNLRKDTLKEISMADNNNDGKNYLPLNNKMFASSSHGNAFGMKKKRAVRSLSANLYGLINQHGILSDESEQSQKESGFSFSKDTVDRSKHEMTDGQDHYHHQYKNSRFVMSDTESSDPRTHWTISRKPAESDVDINGNRPKNVYQQKLQVFIPQTKDNFFVNDRRKQSPQIRRSLFDSESPKKVSLFTAGRKSLSEEKDMYSAVTVNGCDTHAKGTEPFSESEISKYKQLCQDLENLVLLAKRDQTEEVNIAESSEDPIALIGKALSSHSSSIKTEKSRNEMSEAQKNMEEVPSFDIGICDSKLNENIEHETSTKGNSANPMDMYDKNIEKETGTKVNSENSTETYSDDQTTLTISNSLVNTESKEPRNEFSLFDRRHSSASESSNKITASFDSIHDEYEDAISVGNLPGVEQKIIINDNDNGKSILNNRVTNKENADSCEGEPISNISADSQKKHDTSSSENDSPCADELPSNDEKTEEWNDSALEQEEEEEEEETACNLHVANDNQSQKNNVEAEVMGTVAKDKVPAITPDINTNEPNLNVTNHFMESEGSNSPHLEKHICDGAKEVVTGKIEIEETRISDSSQDTPILQVMVAAGATALMAASAGNSSNGMEAGSLQRENLSPVVRYNDVQRGQQAAEHEKRNVASTSSGAIKRSLLKEQKNATALAEKANNRLISRVESREGSKSPTTSSKTTPVRETKTSRLRAASIVSPSGGSSSARRTVTSETSSPWRLQPATASCMKDKSSMSSDSGSATSVTKERDKSHKRKSYLNRSLHTEEVPSEHSSRYENPERRPRRLPGKRNHITTTEAPSSSDSGNSRQSPSNSRRKCLDSNEGPRRDTARHDISSTKTYTSPSATSVASSSGVKSSTKHHAGNLGLDDSEVSRRVDALTALTKATMERVERLTSSASPPSNSRPRSVLPDDQATCISPVTSRTVLDGSEHTATNVHISSSSPSKCSILKKPNEDIVQDSPVARHHPPVSILKHKIPESESGQTSSNSSHLVPVTFSPSVVEQQSSKRHGILKKRSSLDESEILRRRSCSPDVSFAENSYSEFRPILKNQRRLSLDEIVRRAQSPDPHLPSILKRKSSREDDGEDRQLGSPEPQGILKRKSGSNNSGSNTGLHVSIAAAVMKAAASGAELVDTSEVRPILKKKHSREESSSSDPSSLEPRPILKKKYSTESDEHDEKPMKTILKCSRKSSQDDSNNESDTVSPKKLSVLRNRLTQSRSVGLSDCDTVRPILKQSYSRDNVPRHRLNFYEEDIFNNKEQAVGIGPEDLVLRKRAQSVGHVHTPDNKGELPALLSKRRSLESASLTDVQPEKFASRLSPMRRTLALQQDSLSSQYNECSHAVAFTAAMPLPDSISVEKLPGYGADKLEKHRLDTTGTPRPTTGHDQQKPSSTDSVINIKSAVQMSESKDSMLDSSSEKPSERTTLEERSEVSGVGSHHPGPSNGIDKVLEGSEKKKLDLMEPPKQPENEAKNIVQRSSSVSQMASHFKALEEQVKAAAKENVTRRAPQKGSRGMQRYRERKEQGASDRFNTQPITYQELQEAVLLNQRNTGQNTRTEGTDGTESSTAADDEFDPSKLSLADRVRLFNQKIATEGTPVAGGPSQDVCERTPRRRPAARYKTQPITFEEVEVACRITPHDTSRNHQVPPETTGYNTSQESKRLVESRQLSKSSSASHIEPPRGILKTSSSQASAALRPKAPELEGFKLLKSVLKRESEEQQNPAEGSDIHLRSILKADSSLKAEETMTTAEEHKKLDKCLPKMSRNANTNLAKVLLSVESSANMNKRMGNVKSVDEVAKKSQHVYREEKENKWDDIEKQVDANHEHLDTTDDIKSTYENVDKHGGYQATSRPGRQHLKHPMSSSTDGTPRTSDDETSSSGGREVRNIIRNEAVHRRRQAALAKQAKQASTGLSKSSSHHELSSESASSNTKTRWGPGETHLGIPLPGLCRSATQPMPGSEPVDIPGASIADRLAALKHSGSTSWKRRVPCEPELRLHNPKFQDNDPPEGSCSPRKEDMVIKQGVLADRLGKLESATEGWKKRVATTDAVKFSVAGKMKVEQSETFFTLPSPLIEATGNGNDRRKKTPRAERFRGRKGDMKEIASTPTSPNKETTIVFQRSYSEPITDESGEECVSVDQRLSPTVTVPRADDETFTAFFSGVSLERCENENLDLTNSDFDVITSYSELLVQKRTVQTQRRRLASKNPLRTLAARTDLKTEYTEVRTGVAERVMKSLNIEKLAKGSSLAVEALAGLASTEDFSAITLRNTATGPVTTLNAHKDLMLIQVKGRRHVQVRLVEPIAASINSGDNYLLVTPTEVYNYVGKYSNVIERARGAEIALSIQQHKDLGCVSNQVITVTEGKPTCSKNQTQSFWKNLGIDGVDVEVVEAGHPDEDELYESALVDTNMVYEVTGEELVPLGEFWGAIPKIEMLDPSKILVFDFGTEMYIWNGKTASLHKRKFASQLAKELWEEGYDYSECTICPITAASLIGTRAKSESVEKKGSARPEWCLLAKVTQHMESILFREKFLDWPDFSRVIRTKGGDDKEQVDGSIIVLPSNVNTMIEPNETPVDLVLEGSHLGRGTDWYDEELMRQSQITTLTVTLWHIDEYSHTLLADTSIGQFHTGDSYIVRWTYRITITGRELSGQPSKHSAMGRDRCAYFIWQGEMASLNEQGTAALLTVELDHEKGPQVRVVQGFEPAAFLNLFSGGMVVHAGKKIEKCSDHKCRLYICRGTIESEVSLVEVACSARQLRSRGSLVLLNTETSKLYVWHGCSALPHIRQNAVNAATKLKTNKPEEAGLTADSDINICEINEGEEPDEFFKALGGTNQKLYVSLRGSAIKEYTSRLFHLSSISGDFIPTELLCAHRGNLTTPFPFLQKELYQVNQPALFLLDNGDELWVWQGWWPDSGEEDQTGSGAVRWQAERRAAMTTAIQYWLATHPESNNFPVYLVWAGLEPLQFTNLFPTWVDRDDIAELNIKDGRKPGEVLTVESELARLTQSTYPPAQLLQRPLPEGVDPTHLEVYLSPQHFKELLGISKEEFQELPVWKQMNLKKEIGLF